jgi:hypothetical protein
VLAEEQIRRWEPEPQRVVYRQPVAHRRPPSRRSPSTSVYTRRRIMAAVVLTVVVLAVWVTLRSVGSAAVLTAPDASRPMMSIGARTYVVQPGETFWSIARRLDPDGDPRPVVDRLVAAHDGNALQAGEVIVLPPTTDG